MKSGEIRVGSLLLHNGNWSYREHSSPKIIIWNESDWYAVGESTMDLNDLSGVPITEELLVKFGFKWKEETARPFEKYWSNGIAAIDLVRQKFYIMRFKEGENHAEIKLPNYAHDLQNLHYALTKTELTLK